ncbi:MAG: DEAD/DEAH box helicase [Dehalococcoidia bacterium]|nr:DEAD/DEAH box helicase [Dehalococcoidia bacterium]
MKVEELKRLGIEEKFIRIWHDNGINELTEIQEAALTDTSLLQGSNVFIAAPTSGGKTFIGEVLAVKAANDLHRAIYLVPYRALAEEKFLDFWGKYHDMGISIVVSSGDHAEFDADIRRGDFSIAIVVYEKLAQLLVQSPGIISDCHLLIADETQLIRDRERGPLLELLLTRIKRLKPAPQIICLSATVKELGGFDSWLNAKLIETKNRPVPLLEGIIEQARTIKLHNVAEHLTEMKEFNLPSSNEGKEATLGALVKGLKSGEQMLVFRTRVDDTERTAAKLAQSLPVNRVTGQIRDRIMLLEDSPLRLFLNKYIERRIAYHNAGLSVEERRLVEHLFNEGILQIIVTTATLAAGVNMPADIVVIADFHRWDQASRTNLPIDVAEYKNCAGRAGRYGKRTRGISLIIADLVGQTNQLEKKYIFGDPPELVSAIPMQPELAQQVLVVIGGQLADNKSDVVGLFCDSFAFRSFYKPEGCESELTQAIDAGIEQLLALGLITEQDGKLQVTSLGKVAARSGVYIETFGVLKDMVESDALETASTADLLSNITNVLEMRRLRPFDSGKRAQLLYRWVSGESIMKLATDFSSQYSVGHGRVRELGSVAEWLLSTAAQISDNIGSSSTIVEKLSNLAQETHFGVPLELVPLAQLRALPRSDILRLVINDKSIKLTDPHEIIDADPSQFVDILSPEKVTILKEKIARSIGETLTRRKVGHLLRCDRLAAIRPLVARVYDTHGTEFERALEQLLNAPMVELNVRRFTNQPSGQPDLEFQASKGTVVISAKASDDDEKPVSWDKSREVLGSVGYTGAASNFIVVGKPDFHKVAIDNAKELAGKGSHILLLPVDVVVELCLQKIEGKISRGDLISTIENTYGILDRIDLEARMQKMPYHS